MIEGLYKSYPSYRIVEDKVVYYYALRDRVWRKATAPTVYIDMDALKIPKEFL